MKNIILFITLISVANLSFAYYKNDHSTEVKIPMQEEYWDFASGKVAFITHKSGPAMKILPEAGKIVAKDFNFTTGTIEFDVEVNDYPFVGISFHRHNSQEEEWFYLRPYTAGNPSAWDAIQYAPIVKGVTLWDMYPQYQGPANFQKNEWIHIKLVIGQHQMHAYVNESEKPTLIIPFLEGNYKSGELAFDGEAIFANLIVRHGVTEGLPEVAGHDPSAHDPRYIRYWTVTEPKSFPKGREVIETDMPDEKTHWTPLEAERGALVNLTRKFGAAENMSRRLVWLKTTMQSSKEQIRTLSLGFSDEVWVMINGQLLYIDKNYYRVPIMKEPKGRCSIENTTFEVPLQEGENEILIGVGNFFYGWGIIARWDSLEGIIISK